MTDITRAQLDTLPFDKMPDNKETVGVAKNAGIRYRFAEFLALDANGKERRYKMRVSSNNTRTIEDFGITREQRDIDLQAEWNALRPQTRNTLTTMGFGTAWLGNQITIGQCIEGDTRKMSLLAALGGGPCRDAFMRHFPEAKSLDDAIKILKGLFR